MEGNNWQSGVTLEDHPEQMINPSWDRVSGSFFETIGARIAQGRVFDDRDTPESTHVAVVNQTFVNQYFPNQNAIGKRFGLGGPAHRADYQIVGVIDDVRMRSPRKATPPMFFVPLLQMSKEEWADNGKARSNMIGNIELHTSGASANLAGQVQTRIAQVDPKLTVINMATMDEQLAGQLSHEHLIARLTSLFGILALLLAAVGLYGITAYSVAQRTSEIGIRTALGATRLRVIVMIVGGALRQIGIGLLVGIPAALWSGQLLASQLYGVSSTDPLIFSGAALLLVAAAAIAGFAPAFRASSIDPVEALRS
jgi:macrolide transport system ATP-binding/permease protein